LFGKKPAPLSGAPAIRRMKTYSAQTGYVYQYYYEGYRPTLSESVPSREYVFHVSANRKDWFDTSVLLSEAAQASWQKANGREFSSTERYALAKMALFEAFDGRQPTEVAMPIRVGESELAAILENLDL
jgi:hypothetical protein